VEVSRVREEEDLLVDFYVSFLVQRELSKLTFWLAEA
jgi:hypothetical protein